VWLALPLVGLGVAGALSELGLADRFYNTAIAFDTFRAQLGIGLVIAIVGLFLAIAYGTGLLVALRADALEVGRAENRRRLCRDAVLGAALGVAGGMFLGQLRDLLLERFHAHALVSIDAPTVFATAVPAVSAIADAATATLTGLVLLVLVVHLARTVLSRAWGIALAAMVIPAVFVPSGVRTAGEFILYYAMALAGTGLLTAFCLWFGRNNYLAYLLGLWAGSLGASAHQFLSQSAATFQHQGWIVTAALLLTLVWVTAPAVRTRKD
jgi:hypothetical protein